MPERPPLKLSFMSANFLGREKNYKNVTGFNEESTSIHKVFSPASTYAEQIDRLFGDIAAMGYSAVDLWTAHCHPSWAGKQHIDGVLRACGRHGLVLSSIAGWMGNNLAEFESLCRMARDLGCPPLGLGGPLLPSQIEEVSRILDRHGILLGFENHPDEKTPGILLDAIGHGKYPRIGTAFDTGWWGTHRVPLLDALEQLWPHLMLVHLKNIVSPDGHVAARWDEGCLDLRPVVLKLLEKGYQGWISLEYEPLDRDPTPDCVQFRKQVEAWAAAR